jgi:cyclopropane fatty-acyl-phospholipid synthase-like methyltransferase
LHSTQPHHADINGQLEKANFEIKSIDVIGVHYAATLHKWYLNWISNKDKVVAKYGIRWYRIWIYFLAYSVMYVSSPFTLDVPFWVEVGLKC